MLLLLSNPAVATHAGRLFLCDDDDDGDAGEGLLFIFPLSNSAQVL